jgi:hypothetical protein
VGSGGHLQWLQRYSKSRIVLQKSSSTYGRIVLVDKVVLN